MAGRLILASASPRRRDILAQLGIDFEVDVADVEEETEGRPEDVAAGNADRKAVAVARRAPPHAPVLGADTVVALDGRILPKPRDGVQAREWLELLSGRVHEVITAIALRRGGSPPTGVEKGRAAVSRTTVRFRALTPAEVDWYVASGEWEGKAGGYAIQGRGAALVAGIEGDYWTVVGLPVPALIDLLGPEILLGD